MPKVEITADRCCADIDPRLYRAFVSDVLDAVGKNTASISILLSGDERIQKLNSQFHGVDSPTDVMAFPSGDAGDFLGDVIVSVETANRQAQELGHGLDHELRVLLVHGILHLVGYTDYDEVNREKMFNRTEEIIVALSSSQNRQKVIRNGG